MIGKSIHLKIHVVVAVLVAIMFAIVSALLPTTVLLPPISFLASRPATTTRFAQGQLSTLQLSTRQLSTRQRQSTTATTTQHYASVPAQGSIAVIGGGASGIFSAIAAAEHVLQNHRHPATTTTATTAPLNVMVLEATSVTLSKVKISGGGRCNVLQDTSKTVSEILQGYPRGRQELTGLLYKRFPPAMAQEWFESRGVTLKTVEALAEAAIMDEDDDPKRHTPMSDHRLFCARLKRIASFPPSATDSVRKQSHESDSNSTEHQINKCNCTKTRHTTLVDRRHTTCFLGIYRCGTRHTPPPMRALHPTHHPTQRHTYIPSILIN